MIIPKHTQTYPYSHTVYDCWCMRDVDRRADWCRSNCEQAFFVDMKYQDNPECDIHPAQDPGGYVDEVRFEFASDQDRLLFVLRWC